VSRSVPSWKLPARAALLVLAAGFMVLFIAGGARFAIGLTLKPIVDQFGWGRSELGIAVGLFQVVSAVAMFAAGHLADRISPRTVLAGGLFVSGIAIGLMSAISAPWQAMVLYGVIFGLGNGAASLVPIGVLVTRMLPERVGFANAVIMSGMSVGQLVVIATMTAVLTKLSWPSVFLLLGAAHLVLLPFLFAAIPGKLPEHAGGAPRPAAGLDLRAAARTRQFWLLMAIYAICGFDDFFVATHVVAFAQDRGLDIFLAGNLLALMGLAGLLGVVTAGAFSDRSGPVWPTAICFAARVASFALVWIDQSWVSVAIFALVFGLTFLVTAPLTVVFVKESFGTRNLGGLTGLITMVHHIFGGLGAYLGAAVFDATGTYNAAFVFMLIISALAVVLTLMLQRRPVAA
jgi:predicted MFS family arabinose efflux permease